MKRIIILLLFKPFLTYSQLASPPTLVAGLSGLSVDKGNLDIALISEIVSEKQAELKKELINKLVFNQLRAQNYTTWEFAYNALNILLNSQSKAGIQKEVLEYAANAALVYSFTEIYLQTSFRYCNSDLYNLVNAWNSSNMYLVNFNCSVRPPASSSFNLILPQLTRTTTVATLPSNLNNALVDMVYDILRQNQFIRSLGFFKTELPLGNTFYQTASAYYPYRLQPQIAALCKRMQNEISLLVDNYYLIKVIVDDSSTSGSLPAYLTAAARALPNLPTIASDLQALNTRISASPTKAPDLMSRLSQAVAGFNSFTSRTGSSYSINDLYFLDQKTLPLIVELTAEYGLNPSYLDNIKVYREVIAQALYNSLPTLPTPGPAIRQVASEFIKVLEKFHKLDKASTYEFVLSELKEHSKVFQTSNPNAHLIFNSLVDFLEKYTVFDKEKNAVSMDVEEVISQIYSQYEARTNSWFRVYFSVGLNQTFNTSNITSSEGGNVGFVAEKLGFKFTPWNFKKRRAGQYANYFAAGSTQKYINKSPLISDLHFVTYASGLLYNIVNVKTEKNFDRPIFGVGFGPSFFNGLDFHFFTNWSFPSGGDALKWDKPITGFSFDIKITEYLTRLNAKRAEKKASENK